MKGHGCWLLGAVLVGFGLCGLSAARGDDDEDLRPGNLVIASSKDFKTPIVARQGDLIQINFSYPTTPGQMLDDLKIEFGGDGVARLGVLYVPNRTPDGTPIVGTAILGAFLVAEQPGTSKVKITPVAAGKKATPVDFTIQIKRPPEGKP